MHTPTSFEVGAGWRPRDREEYVIKIDNRLGVTEQKHTSDYPKSLCTLETKCAKLEALVAEVASEPPYSTYPWPLVLYRGLGRYTRIHRILKLTAR